LFGAWPLIPPKSGKLITPKERNRYPSPKAREEEEEEKRDDDDDDDG
jgi:hypothetical protein